MRKVLFISILHMRLRKLLDCDVGIVYAVNRLEIM